MLVAQALTPTVRSGNSRLFGGIYNRKLNVPIKVGHGRSHSTDLNWPRLLPPTGPSQSAVSYIGRFHYLWLIMQEWIVCARQCAIHFIIMYSTFTLIFWGYLRPIIPVIPIVSMDVTLTSRMQRVCCSGCHFLFHLVLFSFFIPLVHARKKNPNVTVTYFH